MTLLKNIWKKFINVSLRIKFIGLFIFGILFLGIFMLLSISSSYIGEISHDTKLMSRVIGKQTAKESADFILNRNFNRLNSLLKNEILNDNDILYIFVENNSGKIIASAFQKGFFIFGYIKKQSEYNNNAPQHLSSVKLTSSVYGKIWNTSAPILNGKLGIVRVGLSLNRAKRTPLLLIKYITIITIFAAFLIIGLSSAITWWLITPLVKLSDATEEVKRGNYDVNVNIARDDEIGKLSKAFNEMALSLKEAEQERIKNENLRKNFISGVINAQEEERKNISRDLHDSVGQFLSSVKIKLRMLDDVNELGKIKDKIHQIRGDLMEGLSLIHDIAKNLRPSILDEMGLVNAINLYIADAVENNPNIKIDFYHINLENYRLDKHIEINIYRIVQEALLNVVRHAFASSVTIILDKVCEGKIRGIIEDDGVGFECFEGNKDYLGINSMKERAKLLGGELTIESEKDLGTVVKFSIPLAGYLENTNDNSSIS